jgi:hypothetical protein
LKPPGSAAAPFPAVMSVMLGYRVSGLGCRFGISQVSEAAQVRRISSSDLRPHVR